MAGRCGPVVVFGDFVEDAEIAEVELNHGGVVEQPAVEVADAKRPKIPSSSLMAQRGAELAEELAGAEAVVALIMLRKTRSGSRPMESAKRQKSRRMRK